MRKACLPLLVATTLACVPARAADEPLWEAGMGVAAVYFPDYRGSSHARVYPLPSPYFVYRGDFFKADRHGMRGIFFKSVDVNVHMSFGAALPVDSSDNEARAGMPDLKPSVEIGTAADVTVWRSADSLAKLDFRFPLRGVVTVESNPRYIGTQFFPHANVDVTSPFGAAGWNLGMLAGPIITDARFNRHYYGVDAQFATATRPQYSPGGGYGGVEFIVALSKRFPKFWVGGFARYDTLRGAVFEDSPLVTSKRSVAGGFGISWIFAESSQRVPVDPKGDRR